MSMISRFENFERRCDEDPTFLERYLAEQDAHGESWKESYEGDWYFFYGTLMDPPLLQELLGLPYLPTLEPATIRGPRTAMWDDYPAAIPQQFVEPEDIDETVKGMAFFLPKEYSYTDYRLGAYETDHYKIYPAPITLQKGWQKRID